MDFFNDPDYSELEKMFYALDDLLKNEESLKVAQVNSPQDTTKCFLTKEEIDIFNFFVSNDGREEVKNQEEPLTEIILPDTKSQPKSDHILALELVFGSSIDESLNDDKENASLRFYLHFFLLEIKCLFFYQSSLQFLEFPETAHKDSPVSDDLKEAINDSAEFVSVSPILPTLDIDAMLESVSLPVVSIFKIEISVNSNTQFFILLLQQATFDPPKAALKIVIKKDFISSDDSSDTDSEPESLRTSLLLDEYATHHRQWKRKYRSDRSPYEKAEVAYKQKSRREILKPKSEN